MNRHRRVLNHIARQTTSFLAKGEIVTRIAGGGGMYKVRVKIRWLFFFLIIYLKLGPLGITGIPNGHNKHHDNFFFNLFFNIKHDGCDLTGRLNASQ